jgi:hypothetical protein
VSHFTQFSTKLYDLDTLLVSLRELESVDDFFTSQYVSSQRSGSGADDFPCGSIAIKRRNHHEADFHWNGSRYELVADLMTWTGPYSVNEFLRKLHQRYAHNTIKQIVRTYECSDVVTSQVSDGSIQILVHSVA